MFILKQEYSKPNDFYSLVFAWNFIWCGHFSKTLRQMKPKGRTRIPLPGDLHKIFIIFMHSRGLNQIRLVYLSQNDPGANS